MNARALERCTAMARIIAVVEQHAPLRERAAESKSFERFKEVHAAFDALRDGDGQSARRPARPHRRG